MSLENQAFRNSLLIWLKQLWPIASLLLFPSIASSLLMCYCFFSYASSDVQLLHFSGCSLQFIFFSCSLWIRFIEKLEQEIPGKGVKEQLQNLCYVYALSLLHKHLGDFLSTGCITPKQASLANDQLRFLYSQVRNINRLSISLYWNQTLSSVDIVSIFVLPVVRSVPMQLRLWTRSTTPITTSALCSAATTAMSTRNSMRRHGKTRWTSLWCPMVIKSTLGLCWNSSFAIQGSDLKWYGKNRTSFCNNYGNGIYLLALIKRLRVQLLISCNYIWNLNIFNHIGLQFSEISVKCLALYSFQIHDVLLKLA